MHPLSRSGAVGSALRSGRRGRVFESRLLDKIAAQRLLFLLEDKGASNTRGLYPLHSRWIFLREASSTMTAVMAERVSLIGIAHQMPSMGFVNASGNQSAKGMR